MPNGAVSVIAKWCVSDLSILMLNGRPRRIIPAQRCVDLDQYLSLVAFSWYQAAEIGTFPEIADEMLAENTTLQYYVGSVILPVCWKAP